MNLPLSIAESIDWGHASHRVDSGFCERVYSLSGSNLEFEDFLDCTNLSPRIFWQSKSNRCRSICFGAVRTIEADSEFGLDASMEIESGCRWFFIQPFPDTETKRDSPYSSVAILPSVEFRQDSSGLHLILRSFIELNEAIAKDIVAYALEHSPAEEELPRSMATQNPTRAEWDSRIAQALDEISDGKYEKIVLGRKVGFENGISPKQQFLKFLGEPEVAFRYWFDLGERHLVGKSPERLFLRSGDSIRVDAIAGTRLNSHSRIEDFNDKEWAEQRIVARGIHDALKPICNSLKEIDLGAVNLKNITHIASTIIGQLNSDTESLEIAKRLHPTPAIGGWPKGPSLLSLSTMEQNRGWLAGTCGFIDSDEADVAVNIRSVQIAGDSAEIFAGCGIVAGSEPELEWNEAQAKIENIIGAL